ncbi:MAG: DUF4961 domain-containing protein [Prevotella sp.]|jgi:hypothetical protein
MKRIIKKKWGIPTLVTVMAVLLIVSCGLFIDGYHIAQIDNGKEVYYAYAGQEMKFSINGHLECNTDDNNGITGNLVFAMLVPKDWNFSKNAIVTYKNDLADDPDALLPMEIMPETSLPKNGGGKSWQQCLINRYGVGPNVLDDMEWVVFQTARKWNILNNQTPKYTIYIKAKAGMKNLRCKLGFFVNDTDDGFSTDDRRYKCIFANECFEIVGGQGMTIDFCNNHYSKVTPLTALQNDYVTVSYVGDIATNHLNDYKDIYLQGEAITKDGHVYKIDRRDASTLMKRTGELSKTYTKTFWPTGFFGVPLGKEIESFNYWFTNADGTETITQSDDDFIQLGKPLPTTKEPFNFKFNCD